MPQRTDQDAAITLAMLSEAAPGAEVQPTSTPPTEKTTPTTSCEGRGAAPRGKRDAASPARGEARAPTSEEWGESNAHASSWRLDDGCAAAPAERDAAADAPVRSAERGEAPPAGAPATVHNGAPGCAPDAAADERAPAALRVGRHPQLGQQIYPQYASAHPQPHFYAHPHAMAPLQHFAGQPMAPGNAVLLPHAMPAHMPQLAYYALPRHALPQAVPHPGYAYGEPAAFYHPQPYAHMHPQHAQLHAQMHAQHQMQPVYVQLHGGAHPYAHHAHAAGGPYAPDAQWQQARPQLKAAGKGVCERCGALKRGFGQGYCISKRCRISR